MSDTKDNPINEPNNANDSTTDTGNKTNQFKSLGVYPNYEDDLSKSPETLESVTSTELKAPKVEAEEPPSAEELQKQRAVNVNKKLADIIAGKGLEGYLEQRWMLKYIFNIGGPLIYDQQMIKLVIVIVASFVSMAFIGLWGFLVLILSITAVFIWDFYDRFRNASSLIREMGGHNKTNALLTTFINSKFVDGMSAKKIEQFKMHIRRYDEILATYNALDKNEKNLKVAHEKKADIFVSFSKVHKLQPYWVLVFCLHIYKSNGEKFLHLRHSH